MQHPTHHADCVIIGGGIAGLWLLDRCVSAGLNALLLESSSLGGTQSMASQGIIHGGLKYALGGMLNSEADAIAGMPDIWRACLNGDGEVDLRGVPVLSDTQYLWSPGRLAGSITTFFASRLLRGRIRKLKRADFPAAIAHPDFHGNVYAMNDLVIDVPALVRHLGARHAGRIYCAPAEAYQVTRQGDYPALEFAGFSVHARSVVLTAGAGNAALCARFGITDEPMQLRPLRMITIETPSPIQFHGHCTGNSSKPRITITTHRKHNGNTIWYLGGEVAEHPDEPTARTLAHAQQEMRALFPHLDFADAHWQTHDLVRAEPQQQSLTKPDAAHVRWHGEIAVAWPTKLTLAPDLAGKLLPGVVARSNTPAASTVIALSLPSPGFASSLWDDAC